MDTKDLSKKLVKNIADAAGNVADTATNVASAARQTATSTTEKIKSSIDDKKQEELQERQNEIDEVMSGLVDSDAETLIIALGPSKIELTKTCVSKIKKVFPIPREQCVLWADAEFDLRPSGIVVTGQGVFIRSNIEVFNFKKKSKGEEESTNKVQLFYYPWDSFDPCWFVDDSMEENRALTVEEQCSGHFIEVCKSLAQEEAKRKTPTLDYLDFEGDDDDLVTKVAPAVVAGVESAESAVFVEQKAHVNNPAGHGEMVEQAINKLDRLHGLDAKVTGGDNAKNGADRQIGADIFIQTKYYNSARGSLESCFSSETGTYRYMHDGTPMQLEVPKDQYAQVLEGFKKKIVNGQVPGVTDPNEAVNYVREGRLTYKQAVNLTKAGTIESLAYDVATGAVICTCAFGMTFVITAFFTWRSTGDMKQAIQAGTVAGVKVFGISFAQHIVVSQVARTGLANSLMAPSQYIVGQIGAQNSATIVNGIRALSGKSAIYGAAASKHLAKIMRSNVLTSAIAFAAFSVPETYNLASKKISGSQYARNMTILAGSIAAGAGGAVAAGVVAAKVAGVAGTAVAPGVGTAVGIAGGFVGGAIGAKVANTVGDIVHENDVEILSRFFNAMVSCMVNEYMLDETELDKLIAKLDKTPRGDFKKFFEALQKADRQEAFVREFLEKYFVAIAKEREHFPLISQEDVLEAVMEFEEDE